MRDIFCLHGFSQLLLPLADMASVWRRKLIFPHGHEGRKEGSLFTQVSGSVHWVLSTLLKVDFGLSSCWIVVVAPISSELVKPVNCFLSTWTLWSYFATFDLAPLLSHCHSRPSRLCHILPPETVQSIRTAVMPGNHYDPKCSSSHWQPLWSSAFHSPFHAPQGDSGETSLSCGGWGTLRESSWPLFAIPFIQKFPYMCAKARSEAVSSKICNHPFFLFEASTLW